jgi:PAS domain S-box-containing protein
MPFGFLNRGGDRAHKQRLPRGAMIALIASLCVVMIGGDLFRTWNGRSRMIDDSRREAANLAGSSAQQVESAFKLATTPLIGLVERLETDGTEPAQLERLRRWMALQMTNSPILQGIAVVDEAGFTIVNSRPMSDRVNVTDRAFFQYHLTHSDRMGRISELIQSRISHNWVVAVTRRFNHADGSFAGVATATVDVRYFQDFFATFDIGHDGSAAMLRDDGELLARQPAVEQTLGRSLGSDRLFRELLPNAPVGTYEHRSGIDGVLRIIAYHRVPGYPLVVAVALGENELLTNWRADAIRHLLAALVVVALLGFFAARLVYQMRQLARAEQASAAAAASTAVVAARYRLLADTATEMIVTVDLSFVRQYVSPASQELVGYAPEELVGQPMGRDLHPDDAERVIACHDAVAAGRDRDRITYRVRHRDGHWVWVEATFKLIRDPVSGAPREINCAWREVGERIEAEAALRASEERLRQLLESSVIEAIYMLDPDGKIESWNAAAERIQGYTPAEIIGRNFSIFFTSEDLARGEPARMLAAARDNGRYVTEGWRTGKDGGLFLARVAISTVYGDDGTLRGFAKVTYDITNLRIEEEQRAIIIEAAPNGMMIVDEAGIITLANSQVEGIFDYPSGTLVGQKVEVVVPDGMLTAHDQLRLDFTSERGDAAAAPQWQFTGRKRDGGSVLVEIMLNTIKTPRGRIVVASLLDVTERVRLAGERHDAEERERQTAASTNTKLERLARHLARARDEAEEASKAKSRFLTGMTHELRTPLHGILGYAEMLNLEGGLNPTQSERVTAMMAAGEHLLSMINSVLDVAQIEADHLELHPDEIQLTDFARACLDVVRPRAVAKGLALLLSAPESLRIVADPTRLRQVLINLLGNAIKFTPSGSIDLRMGLKEAGDRVRVEVADTGPGIGPQHRDRLFQTFERLNTEAVSTIEGSGVGLALAARLVERMGGQIGYADNPGGGSVFWLELPAGTAVPVPSAAVATSPGPGSRALRVLVVDDEALNRNIASGFLRFGGHEVISVDNGAEAVELATAEHFDVILMDVRMPGMNGLEATRRIRALPAPYGSVPVVAVTAQAFAEQIEICHQAGMDTHVSKPFTKAGLLAAVEKLASAGTTCAALSLPEPPASVEPEILVFDRDAFEDSTSILPSEDVEVHLRTLIVRCESMLDDLRAPGMLERTSELAETTHRLAGGASMLGFMALAQAGRRFEFAADSGAAEMEVLGEELAAATEAAVAVLRHEVAGMAAVAT